MRHRLFLCLSALVICAAQAEAQSRPVPELGSQVPSYVLMARRHDKLCLTDLGHHDPCSTVRIKGTVLSIAWDSRTKAITYLYTNDHRLITDSELSVGGDCRLVDEAGKPDDMGHYLDWLVTRKWADMAGSFSGDAMWYAAIRREASEPSYGRIVAFVQSRYLKIPQ